MSCSVRRRISWFSLGAAALLLGLLAGPLTPHPALAHFTSCTSDPVVTLSNGAQLDLTANISDSASDVQSITYTVHAPAGTSMVSVASLGPADHVTFYADDAANAYDTYTTVYTGQSSVAVTAKTTVVSVLGVTLGSQSTSGTSGQSLHVHIAALL